jgi:hypothetical protein
MDLSIRRFYLTITSVVDLQCFDAYLDPDPTYQFDADPDPDSTHVGKS